MYRPTARPHRRGPGGRGDRVSGARSAWRWRRACAAGRAGAGWGSTPGSTRPSCRPDGGNLGRGAGPRRQPAARLYGEDGRWRLAVSLDRVDPDISPCWSPTRTSASTITAGSIRWRWLRAAWQAVRAGRVVSGGSTLTMQVARLLEDGRPGNWRQAAADPRRAGAGAAAEQGRDPGALSAPRALRRQYRGGARGVLRLVRQGTAPADRGRGGAAGRPAAGARGAPARPRTRARAGGARPGAGAHAGGRRLIDAARAARTGAGPDRRARPFPALAPHLADRLRAPIRFGHPSHHASTRACRRRWRHWPLARSGGPSGGCRRRSWWPITAPARSSPGRRGRLYRRRAQGFVDMTQAPRSPGSTLKPLVYALAFDDGLAHPETLIEDRPTAFGSYRPQNFDRRSAARCGCARRCSCR
jgi:penicillin-binding protein 1C